MMTYPDGTEIHIFDRIRLAGRPGRVVFSIDANQFSDAYPKADWDYLESGIMVEIEGLGLIHLTGGTDPDLQLVGRSR